MNSTEHFSGGLALLERARTAHLHAPQDAFAALAQGYEVLLDQVRQLTAHKEHSAALIERQQIDLQRAQERIAYHEDLLEKKVGERTKALALERTKLERLLRIGITLGGERVGAVLLETILNGAREIAGADGGTFYVVNGNQLDFSIIHTDSLGIHLGGTADRPANFPPVPLLTEDGRPNLSNIVAHAVHTRRAINVADAYDNADFDFTGPRKFDAITGYRTRSVLTVPLIPRGGDVIGALQLINARDPITGTVVPFSRESQNFVEALAAQAAVAVDNQNLVEAQNRLLDSIIELIAGAIDAKSPYTGGHCARVPEIARRLAEAATAATEGPFRTFAFTTEDEWREFRVAAWLHDCGKVTTPDFVVDKATKLETINNRIHEIRTRFEVLWRDAEITYWRNRALGAADPAALEQTLAATRAALQEEFALVAECNIGGETMSEGRVERLKQIGSRTWVRHFDDCLGLSQEELKRRPPETRRPIPAEERLLADRPDHVVPRECPEATIPGVNLIPPPHLYNFGELYNLSITRGTLTPEERFKINDHIVQTIVMLNRLPFPRHLARVPEYAGAHHETLIGTGYPMGLREAEMSVPARIMAVADVFEALTAADRPYKKAKTLSEALKIMAFMVRDRHIDGDLFDLMVTSGVCHAYAESFLRPDQIDEVDIAALRKIARPPPTTTP